MKMILKWKKKMFHWRNIWEKIPALVRSIQEQCIFQLIADHPYSIVRVSNKSSFNSRVMHTNLRQPWWWVIYSNTIGTYSSRRFQCVVVRDYCGIVCSFWWCSPRGMCHCCSSHLKVTCSVIIREYSMVFFNILEKSLEWETLWGLSL